MKKIITLTLILLLLTGCKAKHLLIISDEKYPNLLEIYKINEKTTIYSEFAINYHSSKGIISLHDALANKNITIEEIIDKMELVNAINDGGSISFKYEVKMNNLANQNFYLVSCKKLNNEYSDDKLYQNENIYISSSKDSYSIFDYCEQT